MPSRNEVEGRGRRRGLGKPDPITHPECQRACHGMWGRKVSHEGRCYACGVQVGVGHRL